MRCPYCKRRRKTLPFQRNRSKISRYGFFKRKSDSRIIQRFICYRCKRTFSNATFDPAYQQNKRRVNTILAKLLCSTVSMRRAAKILNITTDLPLAPRHKHARPQQITSHG